MNKKEYDPKTLRSCSLRETRNHYNEIDQNQWTTIDCNFTRNQCCEIYNVHCPLRELLVLSDVKYDARVGGNIESNE